MKLKILLSALVFFVGGLVFKRQHQDATVPQLTANEETTILASTLQIAMFEHAPKAGGSEPGSRGLGTLVSAGEDTLIVTHDHWAHLTPNLHEVVLRDARGDLLLTLDAPAFRARLVYRDGGTMVLQAPESLHGLVPGSLGTGLAKGDVLWVARRAAGSGRTTVGTTVEVVATTVTAVEKATRPARMQLRNVDGSAVKPGDSGGGVWANGQLMGNVWAAGVRERRSLLSTLLGGNGDEPSDLVIAALQPPVGQAGAVAQLQSNSGSEHLGAGIQQKDGSVTKEDQLQATLLAD